jgi:hypothetical protein
MRDRFRDVEHLFRLALVFVALFVVFLVTRAVLRPKDFGVYGHYRAGALAEIRSGSITYAGRGACLECHDAVDALKKTGAHAGVGCEACHGPQQAHVVDAANVTPKLPDAKTLCLVCHSENIAKPKKFPQIDPKAHAGNDNCVACHRPHVPLPIQE